MELSEELIAKAKGTKTPEELAALAKESSIDLTEEEAKAYFEQLHPKTGELSDDELDNVAGGGCHNGGNTCGVAAYCRSCQYCTYEKGLWLCNNPVNMK